LSGVKIGPREICNPAGATLPKAPWFGPIPVGIGIQTGGDWTAWPSAQPAGEPARVVHSGDL